MRAILEQYVKGNVDAFAAKVGHAIGRYLQVSGNKNAGNVRRSQFPGTCSAFDQTRAEDAQSALTVCGKQRYGLRCEPELFTRVRDEIAETPDRIHLAARLVGAAYRQLQEKTS